MLGFADDFSTSADARKTGPATKKVANVIILIFILKFILNRVSGFLATCRSSSRIGRGSARRSERIWIKPMDKLCDEKKSPSTKNDFPAQAGGDGRKSVRSVLCLHWPVVSSRAQKKGCFHG
jgi:hypothetical protein